MASLPRPIHLIALVKTRDTITWPAVSLAVFRCSGRGEAGSVARAWAGIGRADGTAAESWGLLASRRPSSTAHKKDGLLLQQRSAVVLDGECG